MYLYNGRGKGGEYASRNRVAGVTLSRVLRFQAVFGMTLIEIKHGGQSARRAFKNPDFDYFPSNKQCAAGFK